MANTRLILVNEQNTGSPAGNFSLDCPYFDDIPVPFTFQISEVTDMSSAINGSLSKSIRLPANPDVRQFFENIENINISLSKFNPLLRVKAYYYVDEILQFEGNLQLFNIEQDEISGNTVYVCKILGEVTTFFTKIQNKYLTDIDLTAAPTPVGPVNYTHTLNYNSLVNSWASLGTGGYYYGFIDWGVNNSNMSFVRPEHLRACIYARVYMYAIFANAGYTWTSVFLDSTFFKRLIIPPTEIPALTSAQINNNKFRAEATGVQTFSKSLTLSGLLLTYTESTLTNIAFQSETYDVANIFVTPSFTPTTNGYYNVSVNVGLNFVVTRNAVDVSATTIAYQGTVSFYLVNASNNALASGIINMSSVSLAASNSNNVSINLNNVILSTATSYKVVVSFTDPTLIDAGSLGAGTWLLNSTLVSGSNFSAELANSTAIEGSTVNPNDLIPVNIKQNEFVSWIFKRFNLQCTVDKSIPNNLIIEPEPDFRLSTPRTWEHDTGSPVEIVPMGDLDYSKFTFTDKEDQDYYNKLYQDEYKEAYGIKRVDITNDFVKTENVYESGFSPTPYAVNPNFPCILPQILTKTNGIITPCKPNIRLLYANGMTNLPTSQWTLTGGTVPGGSIVYSQIPMCGHADNPYSPTLDLSWGQVKRIYAPAGILPTTWTTNNVYNKYYSQWINRISDKNSKIVKGRFKLRPNDIAIFDPRYPIFTVINGEQGYYIVNKIEDYNPLVEETTMCELLKLTDYDPFIPGTFNISETVGGGNMGNA